MNHRRLTSFLLTGLFLLRSAPAPGAELVLRQVREAKDPSRATLRVRAGERSPYPIPRFITGKFAEHLGANIYNGMDAQILRNPTFADWPFATGQMTPDGVAKFHSDEEKLVQELRRQATRAGWPESELDELVHARGDALACFWTREGRGDAVQSSPEVGPDGGRAQRVQMKSARQGIAQWTWLPLHRVRRYELEIFARSPDITALSVSLTAPKANRPAAAATLQGLSPKWGKLTTTLEVDPAFPSDVAYKLAVTADSPGQMVLRHVFLRPADHVHGADPDVVRLLKETKLPILRWPGGNFVSGYHWEDGVGPIEGRPTRPNFAWGNVERNTFGTDEFIAFCRAVGCEPMICINAGSGTPGEAARWIEYCNGPASSPMGRRRVANGHRQPYGVQHWEVGNELWGKWQFGWTTPAGYVDRFKEFSKAMLTADPTIHLYACGAPVFSGKQWNDTLIAGAAPLLGSITDHPLIGGNVSPATDPLDVYRDFMAVPEVLERKWSVLRHDLIQAGVQQPRLAVTELQLFAHLRPAADTNLPVRLTRENLPSQASLTEAAYDVLIYHAAIRLSPFVEMVTHSATVNHGGGLRKERERVWANPCHDAQATFAAFAEATPVVLEIEAASERAPLVLPDLKNVTKEVSFSAVDALAALANDGSLLLSVVHRGASGPIHLVVEFADFKPAARAELRTLRADVPWAANSLDQPGAVKPIDSSVDLREDKLELELRPYSVLRIRLPSG